MCAWLSRWCRVPAVHRFSSEDTCGVTAMTASGSPTGFPTALHADGTCTWTSPAGYHYDTHLDRPTDRAADPRHSRSRPGSWTAGEGLPPDAAVAVDRPEHGRRRAVVRRRRRFAGRAARHPRWSRRGRRGREVQGCGRRGPEEVVAPNDLGPGWDLRGGVGSRPRCGRARSTTGYRRPRPRRHEQVPRRVGTGRRRDGTAPGALVVVTGPVCPWRSAGRVGRRVGRRATAGVAGRVLRVDVPAPVDPDQVDVRGEPLQAGR